MKIDSFMVLLTTYMVSRIYISEIFHQDNLIIMAPFMSDVLLKNWYDSNDLPKIVNTIIGGVMLVEETIIPRYHLPRVLVLYK